MAKIEYTFIGGEYCFVVYRLNYKSEGPLSFYSKSGEFFGFDNYVNGKKID